MKMNFISQIWKKFEKSQIWWLEGWILVLEVGMDKTIVHVGITYGWNIDGGFKEGEPEAAVSFGEVAMEKQSVWNDFVNLRELLENAGENTNAKQI